PDGDAIQIIESPPGPYSVGSTRVTLTVFDVHGSSDTCTYTITMMEAMPPEISCPKSLDIQCTNVSCNEVQFSASATDKCASDVEVRCLPPPGSCFSLGLTKVNCEARGP